MFNNLSPRDMATLRDAREAYGNNNQILVSMEELNELACVLAKYGRYSSHDEALEKTRDRVIDEVADVLVILEHVAAIYSLNPTEVRDRCHAKVERVQRWLDTNGSFSQTLVDRTVITPETTKTCSNCWWYYHRAEAEFMDKCLKCHGNSDPHTKAYNGEDNFVSNV